MTILLNYVLFWTAVIFCVISAYKVYLSKRMEGFETINPWHILQSSWTVDYTMPVFLLAACVYLLVTKKVSVVDVML